MGDAGGRRYGPGSSIDDLCRACKMERRHTVLAAATDGRPARVVCDTCGSQHNYRGGVRSAPEHGAAPVREREVAVSDPTPDDLRSLERLLRRVLREEGGFTPVAPAEKWRGGELVLRPGRPELQEKSWPIDTFFHKVVMLRNRLRVLEQQINAAGLPDDVKVKLQGYVTACYGSLTSFNVLFADDADRFRGSGGSD